MEHVDLSLVEKLRAIFLEGKGFTDYWESKALLDAYDRTLARRIRWKWDAVLNVIRSQNEDLSSLSVLDWGCGTGVASEALLEHFPSFAQRPFHLLDRSPLAIEFTEAKLKPRNVSIARDLPTSPYLLLVSHVATELGEKQWATLTDVMMKAQAIIWVEPGTPAVSQRLIEVRERLRSDFMVIAPCPHQGRCGISDRPKDWCHFFAEVPSDVHQSSEWKKLSLTLGIDLRALPTSYLVMKRSSENEKGASGISEGRLLGRPRLYKGYASTLVCRVEGVSEEKFLKRNTSGPYELLKKGGGFFVAISDKKR